MSENKPKVTIMIPTYNQAQFVLASIESALSQEYLNIEVIVGDDASTDRTKIVVESIKDSRLKYVRNSKNLGRVGNYRNLLYNHASGQYVINLDGDDYFTDVDYISSAVDLMLSDPKAVMVVAKATTKGALVEYVSEIPDISNIQGIELLQELPAKEFSVMHMAVMYDREKAKGIDFYRSDAISSDWESLYRLCLRGKVYYLKRNIGVWRLHGNNETGTMDIDKLLENLGIWDKIYQDAEQFGMRFLTAKLTCAKCVASGALPIFSKASVKGIFSFWYTFFYVLRKYPMAFGLILILPKNAKMLVACFMGFYRRKHSV